MDIVIVMTATSFLAISSLGHAAQENRGVPLNRPRSDSQVATCSGPEDIQVEIKKDGTGALIASVTTQSSADAYPTYHYRVREVRPSPHLMGGALRYEGNGFELTIGTDTLQMAKSYVTSKDLGLSNVPVSCTLSGSK